MTIAHVLILHGHAGRTFISGKGIRSLDKLDGLLRLIAKIEGDPSLDGRDRFRERVEALERLEAYGIDRSSFMTNVAEGEAALLGQARLLCDKLECENTRLFEDIREKVRSGNGSEAMLRWMAESTSRLRGESSLDGDSYDCVDELVSGVLRFETPAAATIKLSPEMVAYQPTPSRHILEMLKHTKLTDEDVFVDLGSGLGHVPLLVAICKKVHAVGIELEPAYVECARQCAEELSLTNAKFVAQDVRHADFSAGTIFYLYTPFRGAILRSVLDRLRAEAQTREIRVCTFGPCTPVVGTESWLERDLSQSGHITTFRSKK